jgi:hypothetical protein
VSGLDVVEQGLEGTRVPTNTAIPLMISGLLCTTGSLVVAISSAAPPAEYTRFNLTA